MSNYILHVFLEFQIQIKRVRIFWSQVWENSLGLKYEIILKLSFFLSCNLQQRNSRTFTKTNTTYSTFLFTSKEYDLDTVIWAMKKKVCTRPLSLCTARSGLFLTLYWGKIVSFPEVFGLNLVYVLIPE